jgi:peptide/nickel transport system permease protein
VKRFLRYSLLRGLSLFLAVVVAVYLTILIANMGGQVDEIKKSMVEFEAANVITQNPANRNLPPEMIMEMINEEVALQMRRLGMDMPFPVRSFLFLRNAITLDLGRAELMRSPTTGSSEVRRILVERLPHTLLLFGTAELVLFFGALFMSLFLSRRYGSFLDRLTIGLAPSSAAPGWFYGIFLIVIFAVWLRWLPVGGYIDSPAPTAIAARALSIMKHMVLPLTAIVIGALFANIYSWRTFFLIYSSDDHVELAKAKGLSSRTVERRHILRPTLPLIITSFLLTMIIMWMGQIILESVFGWPGIGSLLYSAIQTADTAVIVGSVVIFGYLLASTVFLLDFIYGLLDPRIRVGLAAGAS